MPSEAKRPVLSVIEGGRQRQHDLSGREPIQVALFASPRPTSAVFLSFSQLSEGDFIAALDFARPTLIFELRSCPRFDFGHLNRSRAFQHFEATNSKYFDLCADGPGVLSRLRALLQRFGQKLTGPVMFLIDNSARGLESEIARALRDVSEESWELCELPKERCRTEPSQR